MLRSELATLDQIGFRVGRKTIKSETWTGELELKRGSSVQLVQSYADTLFSETATSGSAVAVGYSEDLRGEAGVFIHPVLELRLWPLFSSLPA